MFGGNSGAPKGRQAEPHNYRKRITCMHRNRNPYNSFFMVKIDRGRVGPTTTPRNIRELTNRRLLHDAAVRLRDMLTAHAFLSTYQLRAKGDDAGESDLPASWKQEDVKLVFKVFSRYFGYFCQIIKYHIRGMSLTFDFNFICLFSFKKRPTVPWRTL